MSLGLPAKFFVNRGIVSSKTDMYNLLRPLLKQTVGYRFRRGRDLVAHGAGWVERIVVDSPTTSSYFTPLAICINVDSFEHLEFDTRPDQLLVYTLVQGDESVVLEFAPVDGRADRDRTSRVSSSSTRASSSRWSCSTRRPAKRSRRLGRDARARQNAIASTLREGRGLDSIATYFRFAERRTDLGTEIRAGLTTFMVMAYIIFVNPSILGAAGIDPAAAAAATALVAGVMTIAMGVFANYPIAIAAGLGLNAIVAFTLVLGLGLTPAGRDGRDRDRGHRDHGARPRRASARRS